MKPREDVGANYTELIQFSPGTTKTDRLSSRRPGYELDIAIFFSHTGRPILLSEKHRKEVFSGTTFEPRKTTISPST